jgi:hypothetical protein
MFTNISKRPICIFSSLRTGSTALGIELRNLIKEEDTNIKFYNEPITPGGDKHQAKIDDKIYEKFVESKNFIIKLHLFDLQLYPQEMQEFLLHSPDVYRIRIRRLDIIKQIVSLYLAKARNFTFHFYEGDDIPINDTIEIKRKLLLLCINKILNYNKILNETNIQYDLDLLYENLPRLSNTNGMVFTPIPENYNQLFNLVSKIISEDSELTEKFNLVNLG